MTRVSVMAILLVMSGCGSTEATEEVSLTEDLDNRLVQVIEGCDAWSGAHKEWCAVQAMGSADLSGSLVATVCDRIQTQEVADQCWEMAVRQGSAPADPSLCGHIDGDLMRDSCYLTGVNRDMPISYELEEEPPLSALIEMCDRTGGLMIDCAILLVSRRGPSWVASGSERHAHMIHEIRQLITTWYPPLGESRKFGMAVGDAAAELSLDLGDNGACEAFLWGPPRLGCISVAHSGR